MKQTTTLFFIFYILISINLSAQVMVYQNSTVEQIAGTLNAGGANQAIIRLRINTSGFFSPLIVDEITFNTTGTLDLSLVSVAKVYFTTTPDLSLVNQFGSAIISPTGTHTISSSVQLENGANYLWLTYDIGSSVNPCGNLAVDAQIPSFKFQTNVNQIIPTVTDPTGNGEVAKGYCIPSHTLCGVSEHITNFSLGAINSNSESNSGCYTDFYCDTSRTTDLVPGLMYPFSITYDYFIGYDYGVRIWCDLDNDGVFNDLDELLFSGMENTTTSTFTSNLTIPASASNGHKRLRVRTSFTEVPSDPCVNLLYGETEDYNVTISLDCEAPSTQVSSFNFDNFTSNSATINWSRGNGDGVIVLMRQDSAVNVDPEIFESYSGNPSFGSGSQLGIGNYVVYQGTGTSVSVSNLLQDTTYHLAAYEYFDTPNGPCYAFPALFSNFEVDNFTSVNELNAENISIYPNPSDGQIFIQIDSDIPEKMELSVHNTLGQLVLSRNVNTAQESLIEIDMSMFKNGLYVLKLSNSHKQFSKKIMLVK